MITFKTKIVAAVILAVIAGFLVTEASYQLFPTQEPPAKADTPVVLLMPVSSPNTTFNRAPLQLDVALSQYPSSNQAFNFNISQGETITVNVTLTSYSNQTQFTIPFYLSVGAFENQPFRKMVTTPPSPYPVLPWLDYNDSPNATNPFEAGFDSNPITLAPNESKIVFLTITASENATPGVYTVLFGMVKREETGSGGISFQITVLST